MSGDVLVLGGGGQVGTELRRHAWPDGLRIHAPRRGELDITDEAAVKRIVAARPWACVINAAAYTAVDAAETCIAEAWRLNALAPALLAAATGAADVPLIHVSTDYVFDGESPRPYLPHDPVRPLGVYGASKEGGEQAVRTGNPRHVIVRTAWLVSAHRSNFVKTILRLAGERGRLRVVGDQRGCPTSAADLARALATIAHRVIRDPAAPYGTYHCVNAGATTWHGFASAIIAEGARRGGPAAVVERISAAEFRTKARRPANSRLSTESLTAGFGIEPRPWPDAIADVLDELIGPIKLQEARVS